MRRTPFSAKIETVMAMATLQWVSSLIYYIAGPLKGYTRVQSSEPLTPPSLVRLINKYRVIIMIIMTITDNNTGAIDKIECESYNYYLIRINLKYISARGDCMDAIFIRSFYCSGRKSLWRIMFQIHSYWGQRYG